MKGEVVSLKGSERTPRLLRWSRRDLGLAQADVDFLADARAATVVESNAFSGLSLVLLLLVLAGGWLWADQAHLDEVTLGSGKVIPTSREQVIQSLEGGILSELLVREGDVVEPGQVLLRIDDTRFGSTLREGRTRQQALRAAVARLTAEATGSSPSFPAGVPADVAKSETNLYTSRRHALEESVKALRRSLELAEKELNMTAPMVEKGVVSEVEVLRLRRQVNEIRAQIEDRQNAFRADARGELSRHEAELAGINEQLTARADQLRRTVVRAPMKGTVKNVRVTTVGGVIQPGQDIMEIVPLDDRLLVEARIKPSDVAFLRPGLPATVKITAYDYSIYGTLSGTLEYISPDTITDERNPNESYYRIQVRTARNHLKGKGGDMAIIPGMTASVEILTGQKTVLDYLMKPLMKARDTAMRER